MRRTAAILVFVILSAMALSRRAHADELSDFEGARRAYEEREYRKAERELESLVGGVVPRAVNSVVRLESRKYLGATYLFLGKPDEAREQFHLLLEEDEGYEIDPVAFPKVVVETFQEVQREVRAERERIRRQRAAEEQREREAEMREIIREQQRVRLLEELVATETVEQVNSRWIAAIPFGVGQFQNGHRRLGIGLAVTQSALFVAALGTFIGHNALRNEQPAPGELDRAERVERALRISNWTSAALFAGFAIGGVIDAQVRFKPVIKKTRERELPEELREPEPGGASLRLQLGLTGGRIAIDF